MGGGRFAASCSTEIGQGKALRGRGVGGGWQIEALIEAHTDKGFKATGKRRLWSRLRCTTAGFLWLLDLPFPLPSLLQLPCLSIAGTNYRPKRNWNNPTRNSFGRSAANLILVAPRNAGRTNSRPTRNMESYELLVLKKQNAKQQPVSSISLTFQRHISLPAKIYRHPGVNRITFDRLIQQCPPSPKSYSLALLQQTDRLSVVGIVTERTGFVLFLSGDTLLPRYFEFMLLPIFSILRISYVMYISYVIGWRAVETCILYVCMYVCMYTYTYIYIYIYTDTREPPPKKPKNPKTQQQSGTRLRYYITRLR